MKKLREYALTLTYGFILIMVVLFFIFQTRSFKLNCSGGLFEFHYDVSIPSKYMTDELAERHHGAFLKMMDKQFSNKQENENEK